MPLSTNSGDTKYEIRVRVRVFVDFWNFQSSLRREESRFNIDWRGLGRTLTAEAAAVVDPTAPVAYQGMNVYGSYDPGNPNRFMHNTVATFPGVQVSEVPRQCKPTVHCAPGAAPSAFSDTATLFMALSAGAIAASRPR